MKTVVSVYLLPFSLPYKQLFLVVADDKDPAIAAEDQSDEIAADQDSNLMDMAEYQKEINAYFEQEKAATNGMRVRRQNGKGMYKIYNFMTLNNMMLSIVSGVIASGNTIALQTFVKDQYFSCAGRVCARSGCPRAHMDKNDWNRCTGEVFRIYRKSGRGAVRVHDLVGLYYPRESGRWLGCAGNKCGKAPCPGQPTRHYGFNHRNKWNGCWGEVFRIYAKGKKRHAVVNSDDEISLYYVRGKAWVSQGFHQTVKRGCLGNSLPPSVSKYDGCAHETFTIWKKKKGC